VTVEHCVLVQPLVLCNDFVNWRSGVKVCLGMRGEMWVGGGVRCRCIQVSFLLVNCHSFDLVVDTSHSGIVNILGEQN